MLHKEKGDFLNENDIKNHIKSNRLSRCYLIFGDEHYLIKTYVEKIISSAVDFCPEFNVSRFDGTVKVQSIYDVTESIPMMSANRVVSVCDYPFDKVENSEAEKFLSMVDDIPETTVLILWYDTLEINPRKPGEKFLKLIRAISSAGGAVCCIEKKPHFEIAKILTNGAIKRKRILQPSTARYIVENCSDDLSTLVNELDKLCFYVEEGKEITNSIVDKVCSRSVEASIYHVSKAVLRGDVEVAFCLIDDLFYNNTEPEFIIASLASAYVDIYRAFCARSVGKNPIEISKRFGYGKNNEFRLTEADRQLRKFNSEKITECLKALSECDRQIKGSRLDSKVLLEKVIVELVRIAENG